MRPEARSITEYEPLFGSWYTTRRLGSGAAGNVYEIERKDEFGITLHAAVKVITLPAGGEDEIKAVKFSGMPDEEIRAYYESAVQRVVSELNMMTKLKGNSHIVSYEDHEIKPHKNGIGWDILVRMELLTPMLDYFYGRTMTEDEVIRMGIDLCEGLELCRQYGIVHRDIKPANIFVTENGDFKLGDFGIARIVEETQTSLSRRGTYTYMAPEIYRGSKYDQTADIYSLGMVLYQCLNDGRNVFVPAYPERFDLEDQEAAFAKRIAGREVPPPVHGSDALKAIVQKAFAFNKLERYQSAADMRADLEALRRGDTNAIAALNEEIAVMKNGDSFAGDEITSENAITEANPNAALMINGKPSGTAKKRRIIAALVSIVLLALIGAGAFTILFPWEIESIALRADGAEVSSGTEIYIDEQLSPEYIISPKHYAEEPISFTSSDESVFTVDEEGVLTATGLGEATLTMTAEDYSDDDYTETLTFKTVPKVTAIDFIVTDETGQPVNAADEIQADAAIELTTNDEIELGIKLAPEQFSHEPVTYKIGDATITKATDSSGNTETAATIHLTALKAGETTLNVSSGGCTVEKKIVVKDPVIITYNTSNNTSSKKKAKSKSKSSKEEGTFGDYEYFD